MQNAFKRHAECVCVQGITNRVCHHVMLSQIYIYALSHVDESVDVVVVPLHVFMFDQPLELLLDHLLRWQEHIFQDIDQLGLCETSKEFGFVNRFNLVTVISSFYLQRSIVEFFAHFHDFDNGFLCAKDAQLHD